VITKLLLTTNKSQLISIQNKIKNHSLFVSSSITSEMSTNLSTLLQPCLTLILTVMPVATTSTSLNTKTAELPTSMLSGIRSSITIPDTKPSLSPQLPGLRTVPPQKSSLLLTQQLGTCTMATSKNGPTRVTTFP